MRSIQIVNSTIVLPHALLKNGSVLIEGNSIKSAGIRTRRLKNTEIIDAKGAFVSPGFIDTHIHGSPEEVFKNEIKSGTTSVLITESCAPLNIVYNKIDRIKRFIKADALFGRNVLGVRIEGPYISSEKAGAQDGRYIRSPNAREAGDVIKKCGGLLKMITIAPELTGALPIIKLCGQHGVIASMGHSNATCKEAEACIRSGANHATHIFNAMSGPDKRQPGLSDAVLSSGKVYAEVILDLIHVHKALFKLLIREKGLEKTILITDSVRAKYKSYRKADGVYRLGDGTIAGSALTAIGALKNAVEKCGVSLVDGVKMLTLNPARLLGVEKRKGAIAAGMDADIVIFDNKFNIRATIIAGKVVYERRTTNDE